jgi:hypothetical protein
MARVGKGDKGSWRAMRAEQEQRGPSVQYFRNFWRGAA